MQIFIFSLVISIFLILAIFLACYPILRDRFKTLGISMGLLLLIGLAYVKWGNFPQWYTHLQHEDNKILLQNMLKKTGGPEEIIQQLKIKLTQNSDPKGWFLLGRLYSSEGAWPQAEEAFKNAYQGEPKNEKYVINYVGSVWQNNNHQLDKTHLLILDNLLKANPQQIDALMLLASIQYQNKNYPAAIEYWQKTLQILPQNSPEAEWVRKMIAKTSKILKKS